jgi:hypothetical protein
LNCCHLVSASSANHKGKNIGNATVDGGIFAPLFICSGSHLLVNCNYAPFSHGVKVYTGIISTTPHLYMHASKVAEGHVTSIGAI